MPLSLTYFDQVNASRIATLLVWWETVSYRALHVCCNFYVMFCYVRSFPPGV